MRQCIYEIRNLVNGKTYYGQHKEHGGRTLENDSYSGSGKLLHLAYKKYGRENFKKTFLVIGDFSKEEINCFERCIIRMMRAVGKAEYNLANGGDGGKTHTKETMSVEGYKKSIKAWCSKSRSPERRKKISKSLKKAYAEGRMNASGKNNGNYGNSYKMPDGHQKGEKNSQFGKHWWTNGIENIKSKECPEGYSKGRIQSSYSVSSKIK